MINDEDFENMWKIPEVREAITAARKYLKKESLIAYVKMAKAYLKTCRVAALDPFDRPVGKNKQVAIIVETTPSPIANHRCLSTSCTRR